MPKLTTSERFTKFHEKNPHVFVLFETYALQLIHAGKKKFGSKMIYERIRWDSEIKTTGSKFHDEKGEEVRVKLSNDFTPYYSRMFAEKYPNYASCFAFKPIKS